MVKKVRQLTSQIKHHVKVTSVGFVTFHCAPKKVSYPQTCYGKLLPLLLLLSLQPFHLLHFTSKKTREQRRQKK